MPYGPPAKRHIVGSARSSPHAIDPTSPESSARPRSGQTFASGWYLGRRNVSYSSR